MIIWKVYLSLDDSIRGFLSGDGSTLYQGKGKGTVGANSSLTLLRQTIRWGASKNTLLQKLNFVSTKRCQSNTLHVSGEGKGSCRRKQLLNRAKQTILCWRIQGTVC